MKSINPPHPEERSAGPRLEGRRAQVYRTRLHQKTFGFRCVLAALTLALSLFCNTIVAQAQSFEQALSRFASDSYNDTEAAIAAIATSGHARAAAVIEALAEARLFVDPDRQIFMRGKDGALMDAATGAGASDPSGLKPVRVNNRVRRAIDAATGTLTLLDPDPRKRLEAAQSVFRSRDAAALQALDIAIGKETDAKAKRLFTDARAAIVLGIASASENDKLAAVATLRERGDQDALALMRQVPADAPAALRQAADAAIKSIEGNLALWGALQNVWYGLSLGSVLLLAAVGLAITFGVMGVINMAHGEMVMIGAYTTFVVQEIIRTNAPWLFDASLFIAIPLAFLVSGGVGVAVERCIIRFLYGRPLETLLATWGLSLVLQQAVRTIFGANNREVGNPSWMSGAFDLGGLSITYNRLAIVIFALIVFAVLLVVLHWTSLGLRVRAVTQNRRMAGSMGIRTNRIDALTFGLGSGIAGIAGVALSQIDNVSPNLGQSYIIDSFMVVVFGGVGNLWGTLVGAFTLGIANKFLEPYAGAVLGKIAILVLIILFIQKRPRGLFALKGRAVEA